MVGFLVALLVIGGLSWYLVFNEPARRKLAEPAGVFIREVKKAEKSTTHLTLPPR
jgi:hypothetical protein